MKTILLSMFLVSILAESEPLIPENAVFSVSEKDKRQYIRRLAKYHFKRLAWKEKFDEGACPVLTEEHIDHNYLCDREEDLVVEPLPPVTLCAVNKQYPGCREDGSLEVTVDCTKEEN